MKLSRRLERPNRFSGPTVPSLVALQRSAKRVSNRWPDVAGVAPERDRDALVHDMQRRLRSGQWTGVNVSTVTRAANAAFDEGYRERDSLADLRTFYVDEILVSDQPSFLNGMMGVYIRSYEPGAEHTRTLASALARAKDKLGPQWQRLLEHLPEVFQPANAPRHLAQRMDKMDDLWAGLKAIGLRAPHAPGLMTHAHLAYLKLIEPGLVDQTEIARLFEWMSPKDGTVWPSVASATIDTILRRWISNPCADDLRKWLVEKLIKLYGDPRLPNAGYWASVSQAQRDLMLRWLTQADMLFFIGVVDATQPSHMWPPRRDFWMKLYDLGRIDAAWVAFCPDAAEYAASNLMASDSIGDEHRFGKQVARGSRRTTSLLVMKIGRKIVVDGCHSYMTHIFDENEPQAPQLFQKAYDCELIRHQSRRAQRHHPIRKWKDWVEMNT